jgi:hypothetical protein
MTLSWRKNFLVFRTIRENGGGWLSIPPESGPLRGPPGGKGRSPFPPGKASPNQAEPIFISLTGLRFVSFHLVSLRRIVLFPSAELRSISLPFAGSFSFLPLDYDLFPSTGSFFSLRRTAISSAGSFFFPLPGRDLFPSVEGRWR